ncbi:hypothetical protein VTO42DRAFT_6773 [Malbranchea cinnamomea]
MKYVIGDQSKIKYAIAPESDAFLHRPVWIRAPSAPSLNPSRPGQISKLQPSVEADHAATMPAMASTTTSSASTGETRSSPRTSQGRSSKSSGVSTTTVTTVACSATACVTTRSSSTNSWTQAICPPRRKNKLQKTASRRVSCRASMSRVSGAGAMTGLPATLFRPTSDEDVRVWTGPRSTPAMPLLPVDTLSPRRSSCQSSSPAIHCFRSGGTPSRHRRCTSTALTLPSNHKAGHSRSCISSSTDVGLTDLAVFHCK